MGALIRNFRYGLRGLRKSPGLTAAVIAVAQRTNEIGLRLALGASRTNVIWLILKQASVLAAVGLAFGLAGAALVGRTMRSTLYGVGAMDASVIVSVGVVLFVTALFASYLPARRAARIDPMKALRTD